MRTRPRGTGCLYRRSWDGLWVLEFSHSIDGVRHRKRYYGRTPEEAEAKGSPELEKKRRLARVLRLQLPVGLPEEDEAWLRRLVEAIRSTKNGKLPWDPRGAKRVAYRLKRIVDQVVS